MKDLERMLLLAGGRRNSDGQELSELGEDDWILEDEAIDSLVVSVIHLCIDAVRARYYSEPPAIKGALDAIFDLKLTGIKYLKLIYNNSVPQNEAPS